MSRMIDVGTAVACFGVACLVGGIAGTDAGKTSCDNKGVHLVCLLRLRRGSKADRSDARMKNAAKAYDKTIIYFPV